MPKCSWCLFAVNNFTPTPGWEDARGRRTPSAPGKWDPTAKDYVTAHGVHFHYDCWEAYNGLFSSSLVATLPIPPLEETIDEGQRWKKQKAAESILLKTLFGQPKKPKGP